MTADDIVIGDVGSDALNQLKFKMLVLADGGRVVPANSIKDAVQVGTLDYIVWPLASSCWNWCNEIQDPLL